MDRVRVYGKESVYLHILERPYEWQAPPFEGRPYACLVVIIDKDVDNDSIFQIADELIHSQCRYVCTWGHDCEKWHDIVDEQCVYLSLGLNPKGEVLENHHVMTTWHEKDTIEEAADFFMTCTQFEGQRFNEYLALFVGRDEQIMTALLPALDVAVPGDDGDQD